MHIRLIDRIPQFWAMVFVAVLCSVQLLEHTAVLFVVCTFVYTVLTVVAFNIAGGLETLPGLFVFGNAVQTCLAGVVTKALIGEPGQSNLKNGVATLEIYILAALGILGAVIVERHFRARRPILTQLLKITDLRSAYAGCGICGLAADSYGWFNGIGAPGSLSALIAHLNVFTYFAIILGTVHTIRRTEGRTNLSPSLIALMSIATLGGVVAFSKAGMFFPIIGWFIATAVTGYRFKVSDLAILAFLLFVAIRFAVPLSQWGRNFRVEGGNVIDSAPAALYLLQNFHLVDEGYAESKQLDDSEEGWHYFSRDLGQMERLTMMPPDDALIDFTDRGHIIGYEPTIEEIENLIPHFLWADKPVPNAGNAYWRELGLGNDETTGISFSVTGDAYHQGGLLGILLFEPALIMGLFLLFSYVSGPTRGHPANILMALYIAFITGGTGTAGIIGVPDLVLGVFLTAALCRFVFPLIGGIFPERGKAQAGMGRDGSMVSKKSRLATPQAEGS